MVRYGQIWSDIVRYGQIWGEVFFNGANITKLPMYKRSRLGLGYLPQESSIFKKLTVKENIYILIALASGLGLFLELSIILLIFSFF